MQLPFLQHADGFSLLLPLLLGAWQAPLQGGGAEVSPHSATASEASPTVPSSPGVQPPPAWRDGAQRALESQEYEYTSRGDGSWEAPNRTQGLRVRLDSTGFEVFARTPKSSGGQSPWRLRLETVTVGRAGASSPLPGNSIEVDTNRARIERGGLTEWIHNEPRGVEQGWTLATRPPGTGPLRIGSRIHGGLSLRIGANAESGLFVDAGGTPRLSYKDLAAWDAEGRSLTATLHPAPHGFEIRVEDEGAVYPVTVDPLLGDASWVVEPNQVLTGFGTAVSAAGDINGDGFSDVIVGAPLFDNGETDEGSVFVYFGSPDGLPLQPSWSTDSNQPMSQFGDSAASAGDVNGDGFSDVIVGAPGWSNGEMYEGRAFLYLGSPSGLLQTPAWAVESDQTYALFGWKVATAGDVNGDGFSDVLVSALHYTTGQSFEGRVFLYLGSPSGLARSAAWTADGNQHSAQLGFSISSAGDVDGDGYDDVIVGADAFDDGEIDEGAAFLYRGTPTGLEATPSWTVTSNQNFARLGASVSAAGDVDGDGYCDVLVGAPQYSRAESSEGRAFLYRGSPGGLSALPSWEASADVRGAQFGSAVSWAGDVNGDGFDDVIIGAPSFHEGEHGGGRAFLYQGSADGLAGDPAWAASTDQNEARFSGSLSGAGDVDGDGYADVLVGATSYSNGEMYEGRAYLYRGSPDPPHEREDWLGEGDQPHAFYGGALAGAGDVNGDGFSDVIVGAVGFDATTQDEGRVFVYLGSSAGIETRASWTSDSHLRKGQLGSAVASAGDVNGDGYDDVIVSARYAEAGASFNGRVFVYLGSPSGIVDTDPWTVRSDAFNSYFGLSVSSAGDVNGDGYADILIGEPFWNDGGSPRGRVLLYFGSADGLRKEHAWIVEAKRPDSWFGYSVSSAGDVNGDGFSDFLIGEPRYAHGQEREGRVLLFQGSASGPVSEESWSFESDSDGAEFGFAVKSAADVNGDGFSDVIVGAPYYANGGINGGRAFVFLGSASGLARGPAWMRASSFPGSEFGFAVAGAGDVNGDGYSDVLVGSPSFGTRTIGFTYEGRADLYLGSASGLSTSPAWSDWPDEGYSAYGVAVAGIGDANGDGYADILVGAPNAQTEQADEGQAFAYYGNASSGGLVRGISQLQADGTTPLALLGRASTPDRFFLRATFPHSLAGLRFFEPRAPEVILEWEVKPLSAPFTGTGLQRSSVPRPLGILPAPVVFHELATIAPRPSSVKWRARFAFLHSPLRPVTPWFSLAGNSIQEGKLRTTGE